MITDLVKIERPSLPKKWNYVESLRTGKRLFIRWKDVTLEIATHFYIAREKLRQPGRRTDLEPHVKSREVNKTWGDYCQEISGIEDKDNARNAVNRMLDRFFPPEVPKVAPPEVSRKRLTRSNIIYGMSLLGWKQQEIAVSMRVNRKRVSRAIKNFSTKPFLKEQESGMSPEEIATTHNLALPTLWSILLKDKSDLERFKLLKLDNLPYLYDVWNFSGRDKRFGLEYPGNIPAGIVLNALYYYTKQGDLVVDPMAGGGVTIDCCLAMGRKCRAYDITPARKDIQTHNILNGYPNESKECDLIFVDPPYWTMRKEHYSKESVSSLSMKDYESFIAHLARNSYRVLKKGGHLAFLIQNQTGRDLEGLSFIDWGFRSLEKFLKVGFEYIWRIACPQSTQTATPQHVEGAKRRKRLLGLVRDLLIFRK